MPLAATSPDIVFLFASAGLVLYVASRAAADALTAADDPMPGRMAFGQWIPIAWAAILATAAGHTEIGITLVFATCVTVLALDLGVLTILAPQQSGNLRYARAWPFVLPAAILPLLAGFSSSLSWLHACMMILLGVAVAGAWRFCDSHPEPAPVIPLESAAPRKRPIRVVQLFVSILLAGVGGWISVLAMLATGQRSRPILATAIISPLLTLPVLGTGAIAAANRKMGAVTANLVGIVLLNLCALLPAVILTDYIRQIVDIAHSGVREFQPFLDQIHPVHFPIGVWRIDCMLVMALGILLVPISLGRWTLERSEGLALTFGYIAYLIASAALAMRT